MYRHFCEQLRVQAGLSQSRAGWHAGFMHFLGSENINWHAVVYFFSFGTLMATFVMGAFSPFCRRRQPVVLGLGDTTAAPSPAPKPAVEVRPQVEKERVPEKDRMAHALRQWSNERADADLAIVTPPPPEPAPIAAEPEPEPIPSVQPQHRPEASSERKRIEMPPTQQVPPRQEESRTVAEHNPYLSMDFHGAPNFYEILQISPRADLETIHRVYRIMASRFHPDNPVSGNHEMFLKLCEAYEVLSRPERRDLYDRALRVRETEPIPLFGAPIFVDGVDSELNRRFGILALLYQRRRTNQGNFGISTLELETRMALPREHLEFTLWYLRSKSLVQIREDNSDYAVTAAGVDYVEANSSRNPILRELLGAGTFAPKHHSPAPEQAPRRHPRSRAELRRTRRQGPIIPV
jgi:curved DNA-binding protein CbpA